MSEISNSAATAMSELFGIGASGAEVLVHTVENGRLRMRCIDYGGAVIALEVPGRRGAENILLSYDGLEGYESDSCWCGMLCGPVAGRIAGASFELDGDNHELEANDGSSCLHSGSIGFSRSLWRGETFREPDEAGVRFSLSTSPGQWGFPGGLEISATYTLSRDSLTLAWEARTDSPTLLAPTFHGYFNLGGPLSGAVSDHLLAIDADRFMPLDESGLPLMPEPVDGTRYDLRRPRSPIGPDGGFDNAFLLNSSGSGRVPAVTLEHLGSGRRMEVFTDQPACVLYTGGFLNRSQVFAGGRVGFPGAALALETQWYPNAPALPDLPQPVIFPGEVYRAATRWRFTVED